MSHGTLTLDVGGESVERVASSRSCADVVAALSMMAAIAIGERRASAPSDTRAVVANTPPRAAQPKKRKAVVRPPRSERLGLAFGAGFETSGNHGGVFFGTWFAQITFAGRIAPALRIGLSRSMRERVSSLRGSASVQWSELTVAPCADLFVHGALRFGPCVNLEIGVIDASVLAPLPARSFSYLWLTAGGSASLAWRVLSSLSVDLIAGARAPLARSELYFEQDTDSPVYRAPPLIPFVGVAFVAHAR